MTQGYGAGRTIAARPTTYKGVQMRSRLEAAYAQHLDDVGSLWKYEPQCFADETGQYLPDFLVTAKDGRRRSYVEVKPKLEMVPAAIDDMHRILSSEPDAHLAVSISDDYKVWRQPAICTPNHGCGRCLRPFRRTLGHVLRSQSETSGAVVCPRCGCQDHSLREISQPDDSTLPDGVHLTFWCHGCRATMKVHFVEHFGTMHALVDSISEA